MTSSRKSNLLYFFKRLYIGGGKNEERDTLEYILEWELHVARVELYRTAEYLEVYRLVIYCTTRNFQFNLNLGEQAQKNFRGNLILGVQEVIRSTLRSFA